MARITVEDCLKTVPNRFELVLAATYRARQLVQGHAARVDAKDKATVVALREIAAGVTDRYVDQSPPLNLGSRCGVNSHHNGFARRKCVWRDAHRCI